MRLSTRAARKEDVARWYPDITSSFRAWVVEMDGEPKGMVGVAMVRPFGCMFSVVEDELRPHLKSMTVMRIVKAAHEAVMSSKCPIRAIASPNEPTAPGLLRRLGFEYAGNVEGDEIYEWSPEYV